MVLPAVLLQPKGRSIMTEVQERMREIFDARDRANMQPTIDAFLKVLSDHLADPEVLYAVGGSVPRESAMLPWPRR